MATGTNLRRGPMSVCVALLAALPALEVAAAPHFREFAIGPAGSGPAIVAADGRGEIWVALARAGQVVRFRGGRPETFEIGPESRPVGIAFAPDDEGEPDAVWIAASFDDKIIRLTPATREIREYPVPGAQSWPFNVAVARDGSVWFTQRNAGSLGRLDPDTGTFTMIPIGDGTLGPAGLGIDRERGTVWFTLSRGDAIGSFDPATDAVRLYRMGETSTGLVDGPAGLAVGPAGDVWFARLDGEIGHLAPGAGEIERIRLPASASRPAGIAVGPDGDVWTLALDGNVVVRYRVASGELDVLPIPTGSADAHPSFPPRARTSRPFGLAFDLRGNLWFSEQYAGQLGALDLGAPDALLLSPAGAVRSSRPLLRTRVWDDLSGVASVSLRLDGVETPIENGRISLRHLAPGSDHVLELVATDRAGHAASARVPIRYEPGPVAVRELVEDLPASPGPAEVLRSRALELLREDPDPQRLRELRGLLASEAGAVGRDALEPIVAAIDWLDRGADRVQVEVLAGPPFFRPQKLEIGVGHTVQFQVMGASHGAAPVAHRLKAVGGGAPVESPLMRPGDAFELVAEETGTLEVSSSADPSASLIVRVVDATERARPR